MFALSEAKVESEVRANLIQTINSAKTPKETKAEWIELLNDYIKEGCTVTETAAMLDLLAGKSQNKEIQDYFNANQDYIKNDTKTFA